MTNLISAAVAAYLWLLNGAIAGGLLLIAPLSFLPTRIILRIAATANTLAVFVVG